MDLWRTDTKIISFPVVPQFYRLSSTTIHTHTHTGTDTLRVKLFSLSTVIKVSWVGVSGLLTKIWHIHGREIDN